MLLDRWTLTDQVSSVHFSTWPGVTCQPSVMRQPRVKCAVLALGLLLILYLQQTPSHVKSELANSVNGSQPPTGSHGQKSDVGTGEMRASQKTSFAPLYPSLSSSSLSSPSINASKDFSVQDNAREARPSSQVQPGNMSQEAIDTEVAAFVTDNAQRKQLVIDECRKFRSNSSSGYQRLVARTMAGRTPRAHAFTIVPRRRFDKNQ